MARSVGVRAGQVTTGLDRVSGETAVTPGGVAKLRAGVAGWCVHKYETRWPSIGSSAAVDANCRVLPSLTLCAAVLMVTVGGSSSLTVTCSVARALLGRWVAGLLTVAVRRKYSVDGLRTLGLVKLASALLLSAWVMAGMKGVGFCGSGRTSRLTAARPMTCTQA